MEDIPGALSSSAHSFSSVIRRAVLVSAHGGLASLVSAGERERGVRLPHGGRTSTHTPLLYSDYIYVSLLILHTHSSRDVR